jgi:hypothetical protein
MGHKPKTFILFNFHAYKLIFFPGTVSAELWPVEICTEKIYSFNIWIICQNMNLFKLPIP